MGHAVSERSGVILGKGLEALLTKGSVLLLCDALDEALGEQRNLVLTELDRFLRRPRYAMGGVVVTARSHSQGRKKGHVLKGHQTNLAAGGRFLPQEPRSSARVRNDSAQLAPEAATFSGPMSK